MHKKDLLIEFYLGYIIACFTKYEMTILLTKISQSVEDNQDILMSLGKLIGVKNSHILIIILFPDQR